MKLFSGHVLAPEWNFLSKFVIRKDGSSNPGWLSAYDPHLGDNSEAQVFETGKAATTTASCFLSCVTTDRIFLPAKKC